MSHVTSQNLHAFKARGFDFQVDVTTETTPGSLSETTFRIGAGVFEKTGLTPEAGGNGITIDVALTAEDLDFPIGQYTWECIATIGGQVRTLSYGRFTLEDEPTTGA